MKSLKVLDICHMDMPGLPTSLGFLKNLRAMHYSCLLEDVSVIGCGDLREIAPNVISGLVRLEELYMRNNFSFRWAVEEEGKERSNASVGAGVFPVLELLNLVDLTSLQEICHGPLPEGSFNDARSLFQRTTGDEVADDKKELSKLIKKKIEILQIKDLKACGSTNAQSILRGN
ncbi:hypothetical protein HAX54_011508 [Datura stramonium]|uniref:Uncharacterized protein n=1 Tax=Datura stramonium TaxID=4076 RepID=A0ABS8TJQ7_DATST|nr:hypothetical protein [Datura stramonium]